MSTIYMNLSGRPRWSGSSHLEMSPRSSLTHCHDECHAFPDYAAALLGAGLPKIIVDVVIGANIRSARGELGSSPRGLSELLGRKTTTLSEAINLALRA